MSVILSHIYFFMGTFCFRKERYYDLIWFILRCRSSGVDTFAIKNVLLAEVVDILYAQNIFHTYTYHRHNSYIYIHAYIYTHSIEHSCFVSGLSHVEDFEIQRTVHRDTFL